MGGTATPPPRPSPESGEGATRRPSSPSPESGEGWGGGKAPHPETIRHARLLRQRPTKAERRLWGRLRRRQVAGCYFRRQAPVGPYVVDFLCRARHLVVEVDGGQHAMHAEQDAQRTRWLEGRGLRVLRFWNHEVLGATDEVVAAIHAACAAAPPNSGRG